MKAIHTYLKLAERFSWKLQLRSIHENSIAKEIAAINPKDDAAFGILEEKLLENHRSIYPVRDELDAATKPAIVEAKKLGIDVMLIQRTTQAAWHYVDRFQDEWFVCRAAIQLAIDPDVENATGTESVDAIVASEFFKAWKLKKSQNQQADLVSRAIDDDHWELFSQKHRVKNPKRDYFYKLITDCDGGKMPKWLASYK